MSTPITCLTDIEWREVGDKDPGDSLWTRNLSCPSAGEMRWASFVSDGLPPGEHVHPSQKRWLLYEPGYAHFNGYSQHENAHELDLCALVQVEIQTLLPPRHAPADWWSNVRRTWIEATCLQVVPLVAIPLVFPHSQPPQKRGNNLDSVVASTVTYYQTRPSEVSDWYIVTNAKTSPHSLPRLVLSGLSLDSYCLISNCTVETGKDLGRIV